MKILAPIDRQLRVGDLFYKDDNFSRRYRVTAMRNGFLYYRWEALGANPPHGMSCKVTIKQASEFTKSFTG